MSTFIARRWTFCAAMSVFVVTAAGCSASSGHSATGSPTLGSPTSPASSTSPGSSTSASGPAVPSSGAAVAAFGQPAVAAAVKEMLSFSFGTGWSAHLIGTHVDALTGKDFAPVLPYLTTQAAAKFNTALAKMLQHDKVATRTLEGAIFFGIKGANGSQPVRSGKIVTDRRYSQVAVGVDKSHGSTRMTVTFTAQANIQLQDTTGKRYVLPTQRKVRYLLVRNTRGDVKTIPFLISGWVNRVSASTIKPAG